MTQLIRGLHNFVKVAADWQGCVATIGNFDGLHIGHQQLITRLQAFKQEHPFPSMVILFEPQPFEYFQVKASPRLMRLVEKFDVLKQYDVDFVLCLYFDQRLAECTADTFVDDILVNILKIKHLIIGEDFKFGLKREGDSALLQHYAEQTRLFSLDIVPAIKQGGQRVSSTRVRQLLNDGDLDQVKALLGRPYTLTGRVAHGDERGRHIGFPTANLRLQRPPSLTGVYAVTIEDFTDATTWQGVANVGTRPTIGGKRYWLEVHIFDFDRMIYGHRLRVAFQSKLRDEQTFSSLDALTAQITRDVSEARSKF